MGLSVVKASSHGDHIVWRTRFFTYSGELVPIVQATGLVSHKDVTMRELEGIASYRLPS
jgi:hypothetical protein